MIRISTAHDPRRPFLMVSPHWVLLDGSPTSNIQELAVAFNHSTTLTVPFAAMPSSSLVIRKAIRIVIWVFCNKLLDRNYHGGK